MVSGRAGYLENFNHNGISEPGDLVYLSSSQVKSISIDFKESRKKDKHGNEFRYRAKVAFIDGSEGYRLT
jgi:hypothetical protein